jgi:hypothetical protein
MLFLHSLGYNISIQFFKLSLALDFDAYFD